MVWRVAVHIARISDVAHTSRGTNPSRGHIAIRVHTGDGYPDGYHTSAPQNQPLQIILMYAANGQERTTMRELPVTTPSVLAQTVKGMQGNLTLA